MLQERICDCIKLIETVSQSKNIAVENQNTARKNSTFFDAYDIFMKNFQSFLVVRELFGFTLSESTTLSLNSILQTTKETLHSQNVINPSRYKNKVDGFVSDIREEWLQFITQRSADLKGELEIIKQVSTEKSKIEVLLRRMKACQQWPVTRETAVSYTAAVHEAKTMFGDMKFDSHISEFLQKVNAHEATLMDLTPDVMEWLTKEGLDKKVYLNIRM